MIGRVFGCGALVWALWGVWRGFRGVFSGCLCVSPEKINVGKCYDFIGEHGNFLYLGRFVHLTFLLNVDCAFCCATQNKPCNKNTIAVVWRLSDRFGRDLFSVCPVVVRRVPFWVLLANDRRFFMFCFSRKADIKRTFGAVIFCAVHTGCIYILDRFLSGQPEQSTSIQSTTTPNSPDPPHPSITPFSHPLSIVESSPIHVYPKSTQPPHPTAATNHLAQTPQNPTIYQTLPEPAIIENNY